MKGGKVILFACVVALVAAMGCASSTQGSRQATLTTATVVLNTMLKSVETYDKTTGDAIVSSATSKEQGFVDLKKLRDRVRTAEKYITGGLDAVGVANTVNDDASLAGVQKALNEAITDVTALTGGK